MKKENSLKREKKQIEKLIARQLKKLCKKKVGYDYERFRRELKEILEKM